MHGYYPHFENREIAVIDYIEFSVKSIVDAKQFSLSDPSGNELAVWSDKEGARG